MKTCALALPRTVHHIDAICAIICGVEKTRPILYGVADYAEMRKANAWFIDRTAKIRDLEATRYAVFLRPRRFGKSLIVSMLHAYYDVKFADRSRSSSAVPT